MENKSIAKKMENLMKLDNNTLEGIKSILELLKQDDFLDYNYIYKSISMTEKIYMDLCCNARKLFDEKKYVMAFRFIKEALDEEYVIAVIEAHKFVEALSLNDEYLNYITEEEATTIQEKYNIFKSFSMHECYLFNDRLSDIEEQARLINEDKQTGFMKLQLRELQHFFFQDETGQTAYEQGIALYEIGLINVALFHLHLAAMKGHPTAQYMMGMEYEEIECFDIAKDWYYKIVENNEDFIEIKDSVADIFEDIEEYLAYRILAGSLGDIDKEVIKKFYD